ncbi:hypothetical protein JRO89_XS03G0047000 [Xanthoceras sorbifolium]|uniref:AMP-dependent synthetase/ligase domain-containing protein n=1 Tax=Xanthoceras sorbifolium TaxID=99658 RepID=A0ABQ8I8M9_9ROSI|nr:hypothetical protein JRO89_XS03G0047000 [Xanthoceras sorbifolium]
MATLSSTSPLLLCSSDSHHALHFLVSHSNFNASRLFARTCVATGIQMSRNLRFRVCSQSKTEEMQIRRCPPLLERTSLSSNGALASDEWKAVPDIWRSSAEKYGDRVALVDPYHDPPSNMTYKQLEQEILDFAEGLRIIGVKPEEKLSLFADNSCRWIVADQGGQQFQYPCLIISFLLEQTLAAAPPSGRRSSTTAAYSGNRLST